MWPSFVKNRKTAWLLYNEAKSWHVRPSILIDIQDTYVAFCFDQAIGYWGITIENELDKVEGKNARDTEEKRKAILEGYMQDKSEGPRKGQFADPALMFI